MSSRSKAPALLRHALLTVVVLLVLGALATWANAVLEEQVISSQEQKLLAVARASTVAIDPADLAAVDGREDMASAAYGRLRRALRHARASDPDLRYAYIVRHVQGDDWIFVADADDEDKDADQDGSISEGERATLPGQALDAAHYNASLLEGLNRPTTDMNPTPDPPWGITVSGFAPLCPDAPAEAPCRHMLLGLDMEFSTVLAHVERIRSSLYVLALILTALIVLTANLYLRSRDALARSIHLQKQLITTKIHLSKFVPDTVRRLIEDNPDDPAFEKTPRDISVMFLDLAGYTRLSELIPRATMNHLIESYFSVFLDVIREHNGDVNETLGDGLMAIFIDDDPRAHALNAVRCALAVQRRTAELNQRFRGEFPEVTMNIGITTGTALVGSTRFEGSAGSRWTFTASGPVTNLAARLADFATGGTIAIDRETRDRAGVDPGVIAFDDLGPQRLKNVSEPTPVFRVREGQAAPLVAASQPQPHSNTSP